ncbi:proton-coupled folate transporter, partial [Aphelenchoides avenae]
IPVSCNAYLADITEDPELLTIRSGVFSIAQTLAQVIGGVAAALCYGMLIAIAVDIELFMYLLAFFYTMWRIPQKPATRFELERRRVSTLISTASTERYPKESCRDFFAELWQLLKSGFKAYTRKRVGHRRTFIWITVVVLMVTYTTMVETRISPVINAYVFRKGNERQRENVGLDWHANDLGYWNGTGFMLLILGTVFGLLVFKKFLKMRETSLILIAVASSTARTVLIAFAYDSDLIMYLAQVAGLFSGMAQPAIVSFIVQ